MGDRAADRHDPRPVLIVTGLVQEARIAEGPGYTVICSSSDPVQLRVMLAGFDPASIRGVVSFGVAGGLDPKLKSGDVVVATEVVAGQRLIMDMFPLAKQVQIACDTAKGAAARLAGIEAPKHEDNEASLEDLRARIAKTLAFIETVPADAIAGADERAIEIVKHVDEFAIAIQHRARHARGRAPEHDAHVAREFFHRGGRLDQLA